MLIYLDTETVVLRGSARSLASGGNVLLGAAETVMGLTEALMPGGQHRGFYAKRQIASATTAPAVSMQHLAVGF